jgi:hypothetical protein
VSTDSSTCFGELMFVVSFLEVPLSSLCCSKLELVPVESFNVREVSIEVFCRCSSSG